jgi:hypothetical protein
MLRIPHCLDNRLTDGGKKHYFSASGTHFCYRLRKPQDLVRPEGSRKLKQNSFTSSGLEPATFRLVAQCLSHYATSCLRYKDLECRNSKHKLKNGRGTKRIFEHQLKVEYTPALGIFSFQLENSFASHQCIGIGIQIRSCNLCQASSKG